MKFNIKSLLGTKKIRRKLNRSKILTLEQRAAMAERFIRTAKEYQLDDFHVNKDRMSGYIEVDSGIRDRYNKRVLGQVLWQVTSHGDIQIASVIPKKMTDAENYLDKLIDYNELGKKREDQIKLCRRIARYEGIVATAIEVLTALIPMNGWNVTNVKGKAKTLCEEWLKRVNGFSVEGTNSFQVEDIGGIEEWVSDVYRTILRDGDYVGMLKWDNVEIEKLGQKYALPKSIESFDVLKLEWPKEFQEIKKKVFYVELPSIVRKVALGEQPPPKSQKEKDLINTIKNSLSKELISNIRKYDGKPPLPGKFVVHFSRNASNNNWGTPYIVKCFPALAYKNRIRQLDNSTIAGLVQRVWIIKIGSDNPDSQYHDVEPERFALLVNSFKKLKTNNMILWPGPDIEKEELTSSDSNILSFDGRYKEADDDIQRALGIPRILIDGTGDEKTDFDNFISTLSILEKFTKRIERFINKVLRQIMVENGMERKFPEFKFRTIELRDRKGIRLLAERLYEKGLIGRRDALIDLGKNPDEVIQNQISEGKEKLNDKIPRPPLPFQGKGRPDGTPDGEGTGKDNPNPKNTNNRNNQKDS